MSFKLLPDIILEICYMLEEACSCRHLGRTGYSKNISKNMHMVEKSSNCVNFNKNSKLNILIDEC